MATVKQCVQLTAVVMILAVMNAQNVCGQSIFTPRIGAIDGNITISAQEIKLMEGPSDPIIDLKHTLTALLSSVSVIMSCGERKLESVDSVVRQARSAGLLVSVFQTSNLTEIRNSIHSRVCELKHHA